MKSIHSKSRRQPTCSRCRFHGMIEVRVLQHQCPYKSCTCSSCLLVKRRAMMYRSNKGISHQPYTRTSPETEDSPPTRSSMECSSPWDSKSSSGSSYSSSTPGLEWQQQQHSTQNINQTQSSQTRSPQFQNQSGHVSNDGKISDFRSLCITFPDHPPSQLRAIFEQSGSDFQRTIDSILMRRWSDESYCQKPGVRNDYSNQMCDPSYPPAPYFNPIDSNYGPSYAQNGYSGYPVSSPHYSNCNVMTHDAGNYNQGGQPSSSHSQYLSNHAHHQPQTYPSQNHLYGSSPSYSYAPHGVGHSNFYDPYETSQGRYPISNGPNQKCGPRGSHMSSNREGLETGGAIFKVPQSVECAGPNELPWPSWQQQYSTYDYDHSICQESQHPPGIEIQPDQTNRTNDQAAYGCQQIPQNKDFVEADCSSKSLHNAECEQSQQEDSSCHNGDK